LSYLANTQTNRQTDKQTNKQKPAKHNLLGGGKNEWHISKPRDINDITTLYKVMQ